MRNKSDSHLQKTITQNNKIGIRTPKRNPNNLSKKEAFPYYAGYSEEFVRDVLSHCNLKSPLILDPWNGSGTTTKIAKELGFNSTGVDLNPVMIAVAKARSANSSDIEIARQKLTHAIDAMTTRAPSIINADPISNFIGEGPSQLIRKIISETLNLKNKTYIDNINIISEAVSKANAWQSILLLACFRSVKKHTPIRRSSNPTWTLSEKNSLNGNPDYSREDWIEFLTHEIDHLDSLTKPEKATLSNNSAYSTFHCASSEALPIAKKTIDLILTSPPYCTRIDYAKSTLIELSILGLSPEKVDETIRKNLMGTTSINNDILNIEKHLGPNCTSLLNAIYSHTSSGSKSYYYKNFKQYFLSLNKSIVEISRVLKTDGLAYVVLQGSHYKELEIDLASIFIEMAASQNLTLLENMAFDKTRHFASINTKSKKYKPFSALSEKLVIFRKA